MGRYLEQYDKDYMRMAMLKQEETFRLQVTELHRLYRVQKVLMNDVKTTEMYKRQISSSNSRTKLERWNHRNADNEIASSRRNSEHRQSCHDKRRPRCRALDLELPAEEYVGKDDSEEEEEEEECGLLELTLATGSKSRRRKEAENSFTSDSGASFASSSTSTESGARAGKLNGSSEWGVLFHVPVDINCQRERNEEQAE